MNNAITVSSQESFEQKLMDRLRASIGEMMTDEDLRKLVERGIEKALFEPKQIRDRWGNTNETKPSFMEEAVTTLLSERMKEAVDKWVLENPDKVLAAVDKAIVQGIGLCLIQAMSDRFSNELFELRNKIEANCNK